MNRRLMLLILAALAAGCSWDKLRDRAEHPLESPTPATSPFLVSGTSANAILYSLRPSNSKRIVFQNVGREVFRVDMSGNVILAPGVTLDSASHAFWDGVRAAGACGCGPEVKP